MTNNDIKQIDKLFKKNLKNVATKKDISVLEKSIRKDMATKNDIDDAVAQVVSAVDKTIIPLVQRVERIEQHHDISPLD